MSDDVLILDADSIAYKAAAANESRSITASHKEKDNVTEWANRTAFRAFLKENDLTHTEVDYVITDVQDPRHVSYGKSLVREIIKGYHAKTGVKDAEIYIGGADNFRDRIPLPHKYKGKRVDTLRPVQLKDIRYFMITDLGAIVVEGEEVDDVGSKRAYAGWKENKGKVIQVTEDKDALQCSGWLFNPAKMASPVYIQGFGEIHKEGTGIKGTGRLWLYYQALYGDSVDCYHGADLWKLDGTHQGLKRQFGEMAAWKVLKDCKTDQEAWLALYGQYKEWYPEPVTYTAWDGEEHTKDCVDIMQMYFDCAFMRRWDNDRINCREVLTKLGVI
jgi:hypothetical protein